MAQPGLGRRTRESAQLLHLRNAERQQFDQQLAAQASVNKQALDEMEQRYGDTLARMRQQTTHDVQSKQARHDQTIEADSLDHAAWWRIFVPRLALSVLFGVIIATPLVLTAFGSEVVTRAATDQQNALTTYESQLKACNPLPDPTTGKVPAAPAGCAGHTLPVSDPATGLTQAIGREIQQRTQLAGQVASANATIKQYDTTIRDECNGASGPGLSGVPGGGAELRP